MNHPIRQCTRHSVLHLVAAYIPTNPIILEAGSYDGTDTIRLSAFWPSGTVHAFEPVPSIFAKLKKRTAAYANIQCYNTALGAFDGTAPFHLSVKADNPQIPHQAGSLLKPKERLAWSPITYPSVIHVPIITLDAWAEQHGITHIDFFWLDVQGYALNLLQASPRMVHTIKALYVEVEFIEAYEGQYQFPEAKQWLESHGFTMIARDFKDNHDWFYGNALFVQSSLIAQDTP